MTQKHELFCACAVCTSDGLDLPGYRIRYRRHKNAEERHDYAIVCQICGWLGQVVVSVEPQTVDARDVVSDETPDVERRLHEPRRRADRRMS